MQLSAYLFCWFSTNYNDTIYLFALQLRFLD